MGPLDIGRTVIDLLILAVFFYILINNLQTMRMKGYVKFLLLIFSIWLVARLLGLELTSTVFTIMFGYVLLLVVIVYPDEFRKMLDRFGRKTVVRHDVNRFIGEVERRELAEAMIEMSRNRIGFLMVIAKSDGLDDEIEKGEYVGEVRITKEILRSFWREGSNYTRGAMIVRDNMIVSVNSILPIGKKEDLIQAGAGSRHLAALGVTYANDCVALVVSESTGKITISSNNGKGVDYHFALNTREHDIRNGLGVQELELKILEALSGREVKPRRKRRKDDGQGKGKEIADRNTKERDKKKEDRAKKRARKRNRKKEIEPVSKGFGGYDI